MDEPGEALETPLGLNISGVSPTDLHRTACIATRLDQPAAYDAHYLALAQALDCPFCTADHRLYHATKNSPPVVTSPPAASRRPGSEAPDRLVTAARC